MDVPEKEYEILSSRSGPKTFSIQAFVQSINYALKHKICVTFRAPKCPEFPVSGPYPLD